MPGEVEVIVGEAAPERLEALFSPFNRSDEPGCTVSAARDGHLIYRRAFGMANLERGAANLPSTPMPVGSLSKQFTCAALLLLEAEGVLSLGDPVGRWLPELPQAQRTPTLAQVMKHQGGVRCYLDQWMFNGYRVLPTGLPWKIQSRQQDLNFEPGSRSAYSNGGYLLLSAVIERASGLAFAEFMRRRLFEPCGMNASGFPARRTTATPDAATPYMRDEPGGGWTPAPHMTEEARGDGGMISSADDLLRWARFLRTSKGPVNTEALGAPAEPWASGPSDYRYGLLFQSWRGLRLVQHTGGLPGANSALVMLPDHGIDVALLFNRSGPAMSLALKVVEGIMGEDLEDRAAPNAADHADLLGRYYSSEDGFLFDLVEKEERLALSLFGDSPVALEGCSADGDELPFWADVGAAQMRFRRGSAPRSLDVFDGTSWTRADRLTLEPPSPDWIADLDGTFHSTDAAATLRVELCEGQLLLQVQGEIGNGAYRAEAVAPDLLRFWPPQFPAGKLARLVRQGGVLRQVIVSTPRTRGLIFEADGHLNRIGWIRS